jgi:glycosyltransferase involved in cell wall biosynthesis
MNKKLLDKELSAKILTLGVSKFTNGGMASVLLSYEQYFDKMKFVPTWKLSNKITKYFYLIRALLVTTFLLFFDRRIKILHIHGAANASFQRKAIFVRLGKLFRKKIILHMHAADFEQYYESHKNKKYVTGVINKCDKLIVLSKSWMSYFNNIGIHKSKIEVLNNIVSLPKIKNKVNDGKKINFLFLGEIGFRKGIFDLLKAISLEQETLQNKIILRIGGNEVEGDIREFIKNHKLSSFVFFEGWISGKEKNDILSWADIFILPSYNEGLPIAILEAMSYSKPIISTSVGGIPEVVQSYENGILVEPGNIDQIRQSLLFFINSPQKIVTYGNVSYQKVTEYFPESVFRQLTKIYSSLLNN